MQMRKYGALMASAVLVLACVATTANAQQARQAPSYEKTQTRTALTRSVFYLSFRVDDLTPLKS